MPIYEYRCESCGQELEKLQRMSDEPLRDCPSCAEPSLRRLVSAAGFRLKGSGWYETDFKRDNRRNLADGGADTKKDDTSGGDKTAEPKGTAEAGKSAAPKSSKPKKQSGGKSQPSSAA